MRKLVLALLGVSLLAFAAASASAQEAAPIPSQSWSFAGPFGTFDRASAQRGFQVYEEVCSHCHSMNLLHYGDLTGIGYTEAEVKALAAVHQVTDGPNKQGEMYQRPGRPSDAFVPPFPNEQAARAALNGALPPDLSLIIKARADSSPVKGLAGGADYVDALLQGFKSPPPGVTMRANMNYNIYFPTNQIAMPQPLQGDDVKFADGTPATLPQEAHDVATFLAWASEPTMEERKYTGAKVLIFLLALAAVLYAAKRQIWADVH
jgi:ubiquinol-cytochrome c reductase cytochrome c1 subunit